jgi:hypothetical protein
MPVPQRFPFKTGIKMSDETTTEPPKNTNKVRGKPFEKGHPGYKKTGSRHRVTQLAETLLSKDIKKIIEVVRKAAIDGDMVAARVVLDKLIPNARQRFVSFPMPAIETAADAEGAIGAVLAAVAAGQLVPDEADKIVSIIKSKAETTHMRLIEERLAVLEAASKQQQITSYRKVSP